MKTLSSKYLLTTILLFFQVVVFGQGPPGPDPPHGLPINESDWVLMVCALILAVYIICKYKSKRKPAA